MKVSDLATFLLLAAVWGGSFLFMRIAAPVLGPIWLIEARVLLAGLVLLPFIIPRGGFQAFRHHARPLLIVGRLNSALPFSLLAYASVVLPAGFTSILNATTPLFGIIIAAIAYHERMSRGRVLGFVLGFLGVLILVGASPFALTRASGLAMGWGVIFLGEVITLPMVLGCGLILLGTALANR